MVELPSSAGLSEPRYGLHLFCADRAGSDMTFVRYGSRRLWLWPPEQFRSATDRDSYAIRVSASPIIDIYSQSASAPPKDAPRL